MKKAYLSGILFSVIFLQMCQCVGHLDTQSIAVPNVKGTLILKKKNVQGLQVEVLKAGLANQQVNFKSSNENVVTVNPDGEVTAIAPGIAAVSIISAADPKVKVKIPVEVIDRQPEIDSANGPDGPYINYSDTDVVVVSVDTEGYIIEKKYAKLPDNYTFTVYSTTTTPYTPHRSVFQVKLHPLVRPEWKRPAPDSLLVISDPHAKWGPFVSILKKQGVVNNNLKWIYGKNELLVNGDVFDRGVDATTILWLLYELQGEAREAGGEVYFNYGNHEESTLRNFMGHVVDVKYKNFAKIYLETTLEDSKFGTHFFNLNTELGRWFAQCNTIQIIGKDLFVHAGLTQAFYEKNYTIPEVNEIVSRGIFELDRSKRDPLLFSESQESGGPLWYRGMIPGFKNPISEETLGGLLRRYGVERIIVGHTQQTNTDGPIAFPEHDYRVICIDLHTYFASETRKGRGILIEKNGNTYTAYDIDGNGQNRPMQLPQKPIPGGK
jgi:hypothetical protein